MGLWFHDLDGIAGVVVKGESDLVVWHLRFAELTQLSA
jgi:hypothetical protein